MVLLQFLRIRKEKRQPELCPGRRLKAYLSKKPYRFKVKTVRSAVRAPAFLRRATYTCPRQSA